MPDTTNKADAAEHTSPRTGEWVTPEVTTLDLETAQQTGGGIPGG